MLPLLLLGLVGGGLLVLREFTKSENQPLVNVRGVFQTQRSARPCLGRLLSVLRRGEEVEEWMVSEAMAEAYDLGDWKMVAKLHHRFQEPESDVEDDQPSEEGEERENEPPDDPGPDGAEIVIGKNSPFEGVPNDAWDRFVASLETQKPEYQGPKHIGRYHHSKERLAQLKIEDVSTAEKQYDALVADLVDAREKSDKMIREFEFKPITLENGEHVATLSGILSVIKSAGMEHARSWFVNPDDRKKFPKTTEMFIKANGAF